ncbi:cilia- and flagella-associated protein 221 [Genypterus blacodes]|uniref:cilia- and flagella-associated protein 221 n=1 Tax=Genypterus blacodes TaxID=154954 RepID=UPI003F772CB3
MEVALRAPQTLSEPLRRGTPLPLNQLVEERSRSRASVPNHLLESKIYAKLKSNGLIEAEPSELHFNGFELGKDYLKTMKLINISSEVMNIHIIPTQTKHFQTTYTKKYRLIPGLAYTLNIRFRPDQWRYFHDCVRVHCKGEENLLIPVHAYPVIDGLHIPPRIDLPAIPLGQSFNCSIPLSCSCPVDFEFQVYTIQPHKAFTVLPLAGVIPANGEVEITVTFAPVQYETCQIIIQLVVSQFNTKPYLCTVTGSSAPRLALRQLEMESSRGVAASGASVSSQIPTMSKTKFRLTKKVDKPQVLSGQPVAKHGVKPPMDLFTPAGVARMLMKDPDKLSLAELKEDMSCGGVGALKNRQLKEVLFLKKIQQELRDEKTNILKRKVVLGQGPVSERRRRKILEEREIAQHEYMVKTGDVRQGDGFHMGPAKLSNTRVLWEAGQAPEEDPSFMFYSGFQLELRQRVLRLFQQAARKVVIRCRMNRRLACLKKMARSIGSLPQKVEEEEETRGLKISPDKVFPFTFPTFSDEDDSLTLGNLAPLPVDPIDATVEQHVPFFKLKVPQHYKRMGYQSVSVWDAFNCYISPALARPLRTGALNNAEAKEAPSLTFSAPEALSQPVPANPLRIFNPAPGLQTYKPTPKYLESDLEFHLCPVPRYPVPEGNTGGIKTQAPGTREKRRKGVIKGVTWKDLISTTSDCLSNQPTLTSDWDQQRFVDFSEDILPPAAPPLAGPPDNLAGLKDELAEGSGVQLTPEMIRAQFLSGEALCSNPKRQQRENQTEANCRSESRQMGKKVMAKLKRFGVGQRTSPPEDCE